MESTRQIIRRSSPLVEEDSKRFLPTHNIELVQTSEIKWVAKLKIPDAHIDLKVVGRSGWEALANLARDMKNMGLTD